MNHRESTIQFLLFCYVSLLGGLRGVLMYFIFIFYVETNLCKCIVLFQYNNITHLPKASFGHLPVIFHINMAHNQIHNVSVRAFEGLLQVLMINMSYNNISFIPNGALQGRWRSELVLWFFKLFCSKLFFVECSLLNVDSSLNSYKNNFLIF